jgi:hypothetical protein
VAISPTPYWLAYRSSASRRAPGPRPVDASARTALRRLAHHRGRLEPPAHHVADHHADRTLAGPERVVPVASDLQAVDRRLVLHREIQVRVLRQRAGQHAPLQLAGDLVVAVASAQQLLLVAPAVGGVEDGRPHDLRLARLIRSDDGVHEGRQPRAVRADELDGDLLDPSLHPQQRRVMGLVVDPPARGQQVLQAPTGDQLLTIEAGHLLEGPVDPDHLAVGQGDDEAARSLLEELLGRRVEDLVAQGHGSR